jgi:hypothetical protein
MPIYETGHARNVEHFEQLLTYALGWANYQPTNTLIETASMQTALTTAQTAMAGVMPVLAQYKSMVNNRETAFAGLRQLTTRVVNYFESTGVPQNAIDDARTLKRKIDGQRAKQVKDDPSTPEDESANSISASQQSFTQLVAHFDNLIELVSANAAYNPNEVPLTVTSLQALSTTMKARNTDVMNSIANLSGVRADRDAALYAENTGIVDRALTAKKYVKAAFGTGSPEYDAVSGLTFSRPNK